MDLGTGSGREYRAPRSQESDPKQKCLQVTLELVHISPKGKARGKAKGQAHPAGACLMPRGGEAPAMRLMPFLVSALSAP